MRLQGYYDAVQDRILLRLWDAPPSEVIFLWLTRRQWLAIALACYRARSTNAQQDGNPNRPHKNTAGKQLAIEPGKRASESCKTQEKPIGNGEGRAETVKARLVSAVKLQRVPSGLRIQIGTEASTPLVLTLKGENFSFFTGMVERLAAEAKWDLPAAISRMGTVVTAKKGILH